MFVERGWLAENSQTAAVPDSYLQSGRGHAGIVLHLHSLNYEEAVDRLCERLLLLFLDTCFTPRSCQCARLPFLGCSQPGEMSAARRARIALTLGSLSLIPLLKTLLKWHGTQRGVEVVVAVEGLGESTAEGQCQSGDAQVLCIYFTKSNPNSSGQWTWSPGESPKWHCVLLQPSCVISVINCWIYFFWGGD